MKTFLLLATLTATPAFAASGQYVCGAACQSADGKFCDSGSVAQPADLASTLNSLKCDTSKPFTISPQGKDSVFTNICCVQK